MTAGELAAWRAALGQGRTEFGRWLAQRLGRARPYSATDVGAWERETGHTRAVPAKIEVAFLQWREERVQQDYVAPAPEEDGAQTIPLEEAIAKARGF